MKVIQATWEKRNLGIDTVEIQVEKTDEIIKVQNTVHTVQAEYIVVKIPVGDYKLMQMLESEGFSFIECQFRTEGNTDTYAVTPSYANIPAIKKLNEICVYEKMNQEDLEELYKEIEQSFFTTDRIYLDPYFRKEQGSYRYKMWIEDEITRGSAEAFKVKYRSDTVGFFVHKRMEPGVYQGILMGVYKDYKNTGFGYIVDLKEREEHMKKSRKSIGFISSNNFPRVKISFSEPSILTDIQYVYIKHK